MIITNHKVGDLVKDHFDRIWIVVAQKRNLDGHQYSVNVHYVSGLKPNHGENQWSFSGDFVGIS